MVGIPKLAQVVADLANAGTIVSSLQTDVDILAADDFFWGVIGRIIQGNDVVLLQIALGDIDQNFVDNAVQLVPITLYRTLGFPIFHKGIDYLFTLLREARRFSAGVSPVAYSFSG